MRLILFADPEAGEASNDQVLLHGSGDLCDDVRHLLLAGLVLDVVLLEEHATRPSEAARALRFSTPARPQVRSRSLAAVTSPLASARARLQSIIPAPVSSRSLLTSEALMGVPEEVVLISASPLPLPCRSPSAPPPGRRPGRPPR